MRAPGKHHDIRRPPHLSRRLTPWCGVTPVNMRTTVTVGTAAAVLCVLTACGDDDSADDHNLLSSAVTSAGSGDRGFDDAALAGFVASFRTGYTELAEDRNDDSIEHIAIESCIDLANGADE